MHTPRPWTYKELQTLARYRALGYTLQRAAALLGRSLGSVTTASIKYGISTRLPDRAGWADLLIQLWREGLPDGEIAARAGWPYFTVRDRRRQLGLSVNRKVDRRQAQLRRLHSLGYSDGEVAFEMDLTRGAARQLRRRLGLPPNPRSGRPHVPCHLFRARA